METRVSIRRVVAAVLLILFAALAWALYRGDVQIEDRWNPWAPLHIGDRTNWLTGYKLSRLAGDPIECHDVLATAVMRYDALPDRETAPGCGFTNAVRITATSAQVGDAFSLSCRAAVALALWEKHSLQPEALVHFGQRVAHIEHFGSYSCRNVYGRDDARRSRHATADAIDIAGFVMADNRRVRVLADWDGEDDEARFLRAIHAGACRFFDTTLGPEYNAAHRDHLHLDRGSYGICR